MTCKQCAEKDKEIAKLKHDLDYHPANPFPLFNQKGFEKLSIENERLKKEIAELKKENEAFFNRPACEEPMMDALLTSQSNVKKLEAEVVEVYERLNITEGNRALLARELSDLKSRMTVEGVEKIIRERSTSKIFRYDNDYYKDLAEAIVKEMK